nr:MAG TPA: hypothetical protein [Caudoviricetes sp.]
MKCKKSVSKKKEYDVVKKNYDSISSNLGVDVNYEKLLLNCTIPYWGETITATLY